MRCHIHRGFVPRQRYDLESLLYGWRLSGDLPMRPGEILSLAVTLPNEQRIEVPEAVARWSIGQAFTVENPAMEPHTHARLRHYFKRQAQELIEIDQ